jgi:hypothetical protein
MGGSSSSSKPVFFEGQKELAEGLFKPGGAFASILSGAPNAAFEAGANRSRDQLNRNLQQQGLLGSPLAARAQLDFESKTASSSEQNQLQNLQSIIQPIGTGSSMSKGGVFAK